MKKQVSIKKKPTPSKATPVAVRKAAKQAIRQYREALIRLGKE